MMKQTIILLLLSTFVGQLSAQKDIVQNPIQKFEDYGLNSITEFERSKELISKYLFLTNE